jgi:urease accessory protein
VQQLGRAALPFVSASYETPDRLPEYDLICDAFTSNHVANRASRRQGAAFFSAITRIFQTPSAARPGTAPSVQMGSQRIPDGGARERPGAARWFPRPTLGHFAPVFGAVTSCLALGPTTTARLFVFAHLRGLTSAAVRLNIVGTSEAQRLQCELTVQAEAVVLAGPVLTIDDIAQTAPLLDLWQGGHDRLYSRLFQS